MKNLLIVLLIFLSNYCLGQTYYPIPMQNLGGNGIAVRDTGGLIVRETFVPPSLRCDTTSYNLTRAKLYAGSIIFTYCDEFFWYRNANASGWIKFANSAAAALNLYQVTHNGDSTDRDMWTWHTGDLNRDTMVILTQVDGGDNDYEGVIYVYSPSERGEKLEVNSLGLSLKNIDGTGFRSNLIMVQPQDISANKTIYLPNTTHDAPFSNFITLVASVNGKFADPITSDGNVEISFQELMDMSTTAAGNEGTFAYSPGDGSVVWNYAALSGDSLAMEALTPSGTTLWFNTTTQSLWWYNTNLPGWVELVNEGGLCSINIYNSDGTLLADRIVDADDNSLEFINLNGLRFTNSDGGEIAMGTYGTIATKLNSDGNIMDGFTLLRNGGGSFTVNNEASSSYKSIEWANGSRALTVRSFLSSGTSGINRFVIGGGNDIDSIGIENSYLSLNGNAGTSGQVLTSNGTGNPNTWEDATAGTLQQVTDAGNITTTPTYFRYITHAQNATGYINPLVEIGDTLASAAEYMAGAINFYRWDFDSTEIGRIGLSARWAHTGGGTLYLPNVKGRTLVTSVNGNYADSLGAITVSTSSGTVTSVAQSFTGGIISVAGSPITTSGTLALTVAGTSGGIPYFSSGSTWASSGALAANAIVIGGGAGAAPSTTTTGTGVLTALGVNTGSAGAFVVNGGALGTPSSGTLTNATGLPISTGVSGLGTGVATWLATPSWTNFNSAITGTAPFWSLATGGTLTGTNTITASTNPLILSTGVTTGSAATAGFQIVANSLTTGNAVDISSSSVTSGTLLQVTSTSTASNALNLSKLTSSGANGSSAITTTGETISVTNTGTTSTNRGLVITASGATNNYAILTGGGVNGFGTSTPLSMVDISYGRNTSTGATSILFGADNTSNVTTRTNSTNKTGFIAAVGYSTSATSSFNVLATTATSTFNQLDIGGNNSAIAAATAITFYTAAAVSTLTGTLRGTIDGSGNWRIGTGAATSTLDVNGSMANSYVAKTANYTLTATDFLVDCTANSFTITLPTAVGITGRQYVIKNTGTATTITMATTSSQTIDGAAPGTVVGLVPLKVMSTGANWVSY